ncbi:MAG: hypothetical protein NZ853_02350 [Leptospiraceae bacterium]|nr:hypothetical protein [Leptospiraceae bacterium]MDW7975020.1 hypothetical protein [Leptospiraceae bacterium]
MEQIEIYKEIYNKLTNITKKEDIDLILNDIENLPEKISESIIQFIEGLHKPYLMPLYFLSLLRITKQTILIKNDLLKNYNYYFQVYQSLRKKELELITEEEKELLNEISETLYRLDEIKSKSEKAIKELLFIIANESKKQKKFLSPKEMRTNAYFLFKINEENYSIIYPHYENLINLFLSMIDERKLQSGLLRLIQRVLRKEKL